MSLVCGSPVGRLGAPLLLRAGALEPSETPAAHALRRAAATARGFAVSHLRHCSARRVPSAGLASPVTALACAEANGARRCCLRPRPAPPAATARLQQMTSPPAHCAGPRPCHRASRSPPFSLSSFTFCTLPWGTNAARSVSSCERHTGAAQRRPGAPSPSPAHPATHLDRPAAHDEEPAARGIVHRRHRLHRASFACAGYIILSTSMRACCCVVMAAGRGAQCAARQAASSVSLFAALPLCFRRLSPAWRAALAHWPCCCIACAWFCLVRKPDSPVGAANGASSEHQRRMLA